MRVKSFLLNLGWIEIWLQLRLGRPAARPMRRYRPTSRPGIERARDHLLHRLANTFSPDRTP